MKSFRKNQSGFTLIELLIVVIIVAVLATVGVPLLSGNVERAKKTEADASLGTVRTAMRAQQAENGSFPIIGDGVKVVAAAIGINAKDLNGRYFVDDNYTFKGATTGTAYCASVTGAAAGTAAEIAAGTKAPKSGVGLIRSLNQNGDLFDSNDCSGTPVN